jgi:hypothetical protein
MRDARNDIWKRYQSLLLDSWYELEQGAKIEPVVYD